MSRQKRLTASRRLKIGFVLLVGVSAGLITTQGSPSLLVVALVMFLGLAVGAVLVAVAFPNGFAYRE